MKLSLFLFICITVGSAFGGLYGPKSDVIKLTKSNFAEEVFGTEHVWFVEFYAPWCGHCKNLAPEYEKAATNLKGIVRVGAVDCDEEKDLCGSFGVKGFPTLKVFPSKLTPVPKKKDAFHKVPIDYEQARSAGAIVNFALSHLPNFVSSLTASSFDTFLSSTAQDGSKIGKVLLFTNKGKTTDLYKALAVDFHHRLDLGEVKHTEKSIVEQYKVTNFPTLIVIPAEGETVTYDGALKHEALSKFLEPFAKPSTKKASRTKEEPAAPAPEPDNGELFEIRDQATFERRCAGLCAVAVFDADSSSDEGKEEHARYLAVAKEVGLKFKGKMPVVWLDVKVQPAFFKELDLSSNFPNLIVLNAKKLRYSQFMGAFTESSVSEFFDAVLSGRSKRTVTIDKLPTIADASASSTEKPKAAKKEEL